MSGAWREYLTAMSARQWTLVGAVLLCAVCCAYLLWTDTAAPVMIVQPTETTVPATEVAGLSAAAKRTALRNPFSHIHEHRDEIPPAEQPAVRTEKAPQLNSSPAPAPIAMSAPPPAQSLLVLRGVVQAADGSCMAILAEGTNGAALGVGDVWHGYTLRSVADRSVTVDSAHGTITLTRE